jgi:outer membrane protein OmpA-like peptidoglycan-associated protein
MQPRSRAIASAILVALGNTNPGLAQPDSVWRNYDFVPGKRVIKVVSVDSQPVGRFPASVLEFVRGNSQVVELNGQRWLEAAGNSVIRVALPEVLGETFSIEFTIQIPTMNLGTQVYTSPMATAIARHPNDYLNVSARPGIYRQGREVSASYNPRLPQRPLDVKLQVDKDYAIMYVGAERAGLVPTANFARSKVVEFHLSANPRFPAYLREIVVAVGIDRLYEGLTTTGVVTTRGILFDSGSDRLRPESNRTLVDLHEALTRAGTLTVDIEGHTDAVGDDAANLQLSERRAAAVVRDLIERGVAADRLRAVGLGESKPVAPNDTPEGRRENRRVVIRVRK